MRHFLSMRDVNRDEGRAILDEAQALKAARGRGRGPEPLKGESWALIFNKASTRTRVSFEVGLSELGASVLFLSGEATQAARGEPMRDTARVLGRMVHGAVIRTFAQGDVVEFAQYSGIPTINALTDEEHPCQIMADIFTIEEKVGRIEGKRVVFIGDGACNVASSWARAAEMFGFEFVVAAPKGFELPACDRTLPGVSLCEDLMEAASGADVLYTDVWVSMGKEAEKEERIRRLGAFQINEQTVAAARPGALVMHCLPAYRGLEITDTVLEAHQDTIFTQAENRLHVQKAIVSFLAARRA